MRTSALISTSAVAPGRRRAGATAWRRMRVAMLWVLLGLLLPANGYLGEAQAEWVVRQAVNGDQFQLAAWEVQAVAQKLQDAMRRPGAALSQPQQHALVTDYFRAIDRIGELEREIERIYAGPTRADSTASAAGLQAELDARRDEQALRRPTVERILEQQVGAVLVAEGLATAGHIWPPVRFQFTESPNYLIISPRDRIRVAQGIYLDPTLPIDEMERIETSVQADLDASALVEGTGGFSSYPTMVLEYGVLEWVIDTIAHEWAHTYLMFRPLGWNYYEDGQMRTINETVSSIIGEEVGRRALERFYPDQVRPAAWPRPLSMRPGWLGDASEPPEFEYGAFMRGTRLEVDRLLAAGQISEAEAFMEAQRRVLIERGYTIRKLNQAYFAFHGSYAIGSTATDPIGGKLRVLRQRAGALADFVRAVAAFREAADLDAALASLSDHPR